MDGWLRVRRSGKQAGPDARWCDANMFVRLSFPVQIDGLGLACTVSERERQSNTRVSIHSILTL